MESNGRQLLAAGVPITLADGVTRRLIFDMEALVSLEDQVGGLLQFTELLQEARGRVFRARRLKAVRVGVVAGLAHTGLPEKAIVTLLPSRSITKLNALFDAVSEAVNQGLPVFDDEELAQAEAPLDEPTSDSTGSTSTGSEPSSMAALTVSSGV